jgi:biotin operon repressor
MKDKPAFEIQSSAKVLREKQGQIVEYDSPPWIKLSVTFRDKLLRELKGSQLSVFLCLALHINKDRKSHPSIEKISSETGFSERQVTRAIQMLEKRNWIEVHRETGGVNHYRVAPVVSYGKEQPLDVTPDKMSPPTYTVKDTDKMSPLPLTMSPLTMSDEVESLSRTNKVEPLEKIALENQRNLLIQSILDVCQLSWETYRDNGKMRGLINRTVELLSKREISPEDVLQGYGKEGWWWREHWVGHDKGSYPRPEQIADTIDLSLAYDSEAARRSYLEGWFDDD